MRETRALKEFESTPEPSEALMLEVCDILLEQSLKTPPCRVLLFILQRFNTILRDAPHMSFPDELLLNMCRLRGPCFEKDWDVRVHAINLVWKCAIAKKWLPKQAIAFVLRIIEASEAEVATNPGQGLRLQWQAVNIAAMFSGGIMGWCAFSKMLHSGASTTTAIVSCLCAYMRRYAGFTDGSNSEILACIFPGAVRTTRAIITDRDVVALLPVSLLQEALDAVMTIFSAPRTNKMAEQEACRLAGVLLVNLMGRTQLQLASIPNDIFYVLDMFERSRHAVRDVHDDSDTILYCLCNVLTCAAETQSAPMLEAVVDYACKLNVVDALVEHVRRGAAECAAGGLIAARRSCNIRVARALAIIAGHAGSVTAAYIEDLQIVPVVMAAIDADYARGLLVIDYLDILDAYTLHSGLCSVHIIIEHGTGVLHRIFVGQALEKDHPAKQRVVEAIIGRCMAHEDVTG